MAGPRLEFGLGGCTLASLGSSVFALDLGLVAGSLLCCALGWAVHTGGKIAGIVFRVF